MSQNADQSVADERWVKKYIDASSECSNYDDDGPTTKQSTKGHYHKEFIFKYASIELPINFTFIPRLII